MSNRTGVWLPVDALWLYVGEARDGESTIETDQLTVSMVSDGFVDDPLIGDRDELEGYVKRPHAQPGAAVRYGPQTIGWTVAGDKTTVQYLYYRGPVLWSVELTAAGFLQRRTHRRGFELAAGPLSLSVRTKRIQRSTPTASKVHFMAEDGLAADAARLRELCRQVGDLIIQA